MALTPATLAGVLTGFLLTLAVAVAWGVGIAASAHSTPERIASAAGGASAPSSGLAPERFSALDLDADGNLSLAEAAGNAEVMARFDRADRDRNGKLTPREFERLAKLPEKPPARAAKKTRPAPRPAP